MIRAWLFPMLAMLAATVAAQTPPTYRQPPAEILALADAPAAPEVISDSRQTVLVLQEQGAYPPLAELSAPELRLGGLRIDPRTHVANTITLSDNRPVRLAYSRGLALQRVDATGPVPVSGLPPRARLAYFTWSPDETRLAFTHTADEGVEVWVLDLASASARRLTDARANASLGNPITWFKDGRALLVRMLPESPRTLTDAQAAIPAGPVVSVSDGSKASNRTYQDMLAGPVDDANFEALTTSVLVRVPLQGAASRWAGPGMYRSTQFSPDGSYLLADSLQRPFSHSAPLDRFPARHDLLDRDGKPVLTVAQVPRSDNLPRGRMAVREGRRSLGWRADAAATLVWVEALDRGDPASPVAFRDGLYGWAAPFNAAPRLLLKTVNRFKSVLWGDDGHAIVDDEWWDTRDTRTYVFSPAHPASSRLLFQRDAQDRYADPGRFSMIRNDQGESVLRLDGGRAWLVGEGYSAEGQFPFVDRIDLATGQRQRLYRSALRNRAETIVELAGTAAATALVRIESPSDYPDYYLRTLATTAPPRQLTRLGAPYPSLRGVHKQLLDYRRADGVGLSGVLYLPAGYDRRGKDKLPLLIWAYPVEYKDKDSAAQVTANPNRFTRLDFKSPVYWVTRGYAVLDQAAFPIVGAEGNEPNDTYLPQLLANARAAIDAVGALGYIDRRRVAIGGHSYGAFMVANLLTHTDWFAAGIARSGAYNRTLTPFGFQREERTYWQAPEVYERMSPFLHAGQMKTPLLLIHGQDDGNAGTHTMQSERYFDALKALGAPARLVLLPRESHAYRARESVLHVLWEQDQWLERHVKRGAGVVDSAAQLR
ncbi:MAG TPA: prolyl oligopeptidase family serine peptidase [Rhodanobacter sp.]|nr:prolyl oligopeptidase family serine peptidase [Rhodanobacter sp.]